MMNKLVEWVNRPVRSQGLAIFRFFFGLILLIDLRRIHNINLIDGYYVKDRGVVFSYEFLNLQLPSQAVMNGIMLVLMICAFLIMIGVAYRYAMALFAILFSYFFFMDQILYNNHLYMICLMSFMMIFMPADAAFSPNKKRRRATIPQWPYRLLQFQIIVVFFFGAIAKLNPYWFDLKVTDELLNAFASRTGNDWANTGWVSTFLVYGGFIFDLLIGFVLLIPKTRVFGMFAAIFFNLSNSYFFDDIYIFPFLMIFALVLFMDQEKLTDWLKRKGILGSPNKDERKVKVLGKLGISVVAFYALIQLALPLRHYFEEGYTDWTGEYQKFSWRMKIQHRTIEDVQFAVFDNKRKQIYPLDKNALSKILYEDEITGMCQSPLLILQFARYLEKYVAEKDNIDDCMIKSKILISFNGLEPTYLFDPELDLLENSEKYESVQKWMNPLPTRYKVEE
jgi:vitamin K-dependent gamma-carboxylase